MNLDNAKLLISGTDKLTDPPLLELQYRNETQKLCDYIVCLKKACEPFRKEGFVNWVGLPNVKYSDCEKLDALLEP